jgi:hypothetical protein
MRNDSSYTLNSGFTQLCLSAAAFSVLCLCVHEHSVLHQCEIGGLHELRLSSLQGNSTSETELEYDNVLHQESPMYHCIQSVRK